MHHTEHTSSLTCEQYHGAFCEELSPTLRARLCAVCQIKQYAKGQTLRERYWDHCVSLMLEGLIARTESRDATKRPLVLGLAAGGDFFGIEEIYRHPQTCPPMAGLDSYCLSDCTVAVFDADVFKNLMDDSLELTQHVLRNRLCSGLAERTNMLRSLGYGSAEESVRYVLEYLRRKHIDYLTHEQIALICNRSRQTVTGIMKTLTDQEPDLFTR